jgi:hypothetical protein
LIWHANPDLRFPPTAAYFPTIQVVWAAAYRLLDALPDNHSAILYSLSAITTYGHANITLKPQWQLMGALETLNGILLFGLTTAFMFAMFQQIWPLGSRIHHRG